LKGHVARDYQQRIAEQLDKAELQDAGIPPKPLSQATLPASAPEVQTEEHAADAALAASLAQPCVNIVNLGQF